MTPPSPLERFEADLARVRLADPPADLAATIRRTGRTRLRHRRWRHGLELAAAAVVILALAGWYWMLVRNPYELAGAAAVTDESGQSAKLASGAWIETSDQPATLRIRKHTTVELSPGTRLRLEDARKAGGATIEGETKKYQLTLDYGRIACRTEPASADVQIDSAVGHVTPGGDESRFTVQLDKGGDAVNRKLIVAVATGLATLASQAGQTVLAAGESKTASAPTSQPSNEMLVITNADNGHTVVARVGQLIRVELTGERAQTGWETDFQPTVLSRIRPDAEIQKRIGGPTDLNDFLPPKKHEEIPDPAVGTYVFLYKAAREGQEAMRFDYIAPGGPVTVARRKSTLVATFKVTVKVVAAERPSARRAAERAATLKSHVKTFTLSLNYSGEQDKPFYHLLLSVPAMAGPDRANAFYRQARITEDQARAIIDRLAVEGFLDEALDGNRNASPIPPTGPHYALAVRVEGEAGPVQYDQWLGWNLGMLERLDGLRGVLEGEAAKGMDLLLGRLSGLRREWERQAAEAGPATQPER